MPRGCILGGWMCKPCLRSSLRHWMWMAPLIFSGKNIQSFIQRVSSKPSVLLNSIRNMSFEHFTGHRSACAPGNINSHSLNSICSPDIHSSEWRSHRWHQACFLGVSVDRTGPLGLSVFNLSDSMCPPMVYSLPPCSPVSNIFSLPLPDSMSS